MEEKQIVNGPAVINAVLDRGVTLADLQFELARNGVRISYVALWNLKRGKTKKIKEHVAYVIKALYFRGSKIAFERLYFKAPAPASKYLLRGSRSRLKCK